MKRDLICIGCPLGCRIEVIMEEGIVKKVSGHTCKRGEDYAIKECTNPTRIITSSVEVTGGTEPVVSVKTERDVPKDKIFEIIRLIKTVKVNAPVQAGDVIIENLLGTGVNLIATKTVPGR